MADHSLRAKTLLNRDDPRIYLAAEQANSDPYQAALIVAALDAHTELQRRGPRQTGYWLGYIAAALVVLLVMSLLVWALLWVWGSIMQML